MFIVICAEALQGPGGPTVDVQCFSGNYDEAKRNASEHFDALVRDVGFDYITVLLQEFDAKSGTLQDIDSWEGCEDDLVEDEDEDEEIAW